MPMDIQRRAILALATICLAGFHAGAEEDLTGIWSAEQRTKGGLGAQIVFTPTEAVSTFGALIDLKYEIDGNLFKLIYLTPSAPPSEKLIGREFTIEGDKLTIAQGDAGPPLVMTRVGPPHLGAHPIVGDWTYPHPAGAPALQRFSRSGAAQLSVVMQTVRGPYSVANDTLEMRFEGRPPVTLTIKREGNILITTDAKGRVIRHVKFEY